MLEVCDIYVSLCVKATYSLHQAISFVIVIYRVH